MSRSRQCRLGDSLRSDLDRGCFVYKESYRAIEEESRNEEAPWVDANVAIQVQPIQSRVATVCCGSPGCRRHRHWWPEPLGRSAARARWGDGARIQRVHPL